MAGISYRRHRFPPDIIQHAVWLYLRFTLSYRDVEDLLAERGLDISYETVRSWVLKFGPVIARRLRRRRPRPSNRWHLDEMVVRIAGERIPSTFNAISSHDQRCGSSEPRRRANGGMQLPQCECAFCFEFLLPDAG
jgi:transposase-like protein